LSNLFFFRFDLRQNKNKKRNNGQQKKSNEQLTTKTTTYRNLTTPWSLSKGGSKISGMDRLG
jgi:hypothetical protein